MGKFEKGVLGGFSGIVGPVVGVNWRGLDVLRSRPKRSNRQPSAKQLRQRMAFAIMIKFGSPIRTLLDQYYGQPADEKSRADLAMSYLMRYAVSGEYPNLGINFEKVVITKGPLLGVQAPDVAPLPNAVVNFSWDDNSGQFEAKAGDQLLAVVYNADKERFEYSFTATRTDGQLSMTLPSIWSGDTVHCWLGFVSVEGKGASTGVYLNVMVG